MRIVITQQRYEGAGEVVRAFTTDNVDHAVAFVDHANRREQSLPPAVFIYRAFVMNDNGDFGYEIDVQEDQLPVSSLNRGYLAPVSAGYLPVRPLDGMDLLGVGA